MTDQQKVDKNQFLVSVGRLKQFREMAQRLTDISRALGYPEEVAAYAESVAYCDELLKRKSVWVVETFHGSERQAVEEFPSEEEARRYFEAKRAACRFGLVGWSVSFPREQTRP